MSLIDSPNLPGSPVCLAVVDGRISVGAGDNLRKLGIELINTCRYNGLYETVAYHPDMVLHHLGERDIVYAPGLEQAFLEKLSGHGFRLIPGESIPGGRYPYDIPYNVARIGRFYIHNLRYTDPILKRELENRGVEPIHVKQGYSKCSIAVIDSNSFITSDSGIARAAEAKGLEVLLLQGGQNILLPGLNEGFIGGSTGLIGPDKLAVNGELRKMTSFIEITSFLTSKHIQAVSLSDGRVTDIGSILPLKLR